MQKPFQINFCVIILSIAFFFWGCTGNENKIYKKVSEYAEFKLISFSDQSAKIENGDLIEFKTIFLKNNKEVLDADSSLLNEIYNDTITYLDNSNSDLLKVLGNLQAGDSCIARFCYGAEISGKLKISKALIQKNDSLYAYIKIKHIYKGKERMAYLLEENAIARYITFSNHKWIASENGIYYRIIKPSISANFVFNDAIKMSYKGYFLNHQVFDNYADINPYFEYKVGTQNQLITGLEIGIRFMGYDSEAEFIIPSSLAFGKVGSSTGIVPAYKPVLYKVKVFPKEGV